MEPTCPFSARAFDKLDALLEAAGEDRLTVTIRLLSQPWHLFSGVVVRCILAASTTEGGKDASKRVMAAVFEHPAEFELEHHCGGPNLNATPNDIIARVERYSGIALGPAFAIEDLDRTIKRHAKYARQNGAHETPTFMVDGIIDPAMGSGDPVSSWLEALGLS